VLNLNEPLRLIPSYLSQRDLPLKGVAFLFGTLYFIDSLRGQVPQVKFIQLVPGSYLLVLIISFLFLVIFSDLFLRFIFKIDRNKIWGTKTLIKIDSLIISKFLVFIYSVGIYTLVNTIIPLTFDFFDLVSRKNLENIWSLADIFSLEIFFLFTVNLFFIIPVGLVFGMYSEFDVQLLSEEWKNIALNIFIVSGIITPTIDYSIQITLVLAIIFFYLITFSFFLKRISIKFSGVVSFF
jgi:hypothetical protein